MALHFSSACFFCNSLSQRKAFRISAFGVKTDEQDKVKLGGSDLKVTKLGVGAWSWGDTSYWNNFEWDGRISLLLSFTFNLFLFGIQVVIKIFDRLEKK